MVDIPLLVLGEVRDEGIFYSLSWGGGGVRIKIKVFDSYFVGKIRYPGSNRGDVGLEMLNIGSAWVVIEGGADGVEDFVHV